MNTNILPVCLVVNFLYMAFDNLIKQDCLKCKRSTKIAQLIYDMGHIINLTNPRARLTAVLKDKYIFTINYAFEHVPLASSNKTNDLQSI